MTVKDPALFRKEALFLARTLSEAIGGDRRSQSRIKNMAMRTEAFTTSDFPILYQYVVNASLLKAYTLLQPGIWEKISQRHVMNSLRPEKFKTFLPDLSNLPNAIGGVSTIQGSATPVSGSLPHIPELSPYPAIGFVGSEYDVAARKFGARIPFSWEAFMLDDWGVIASLPENLAIVARRTEDLQTFSTVFDTSGWNQTVFPSIGQGNATGNGMYLAANPPLTLDSLQRALVQASQPPAGHPERVNTINKWALIVPRSLEFVARNLLTITQYRTTETLGNGSLETYLHDGTNLGTQIEVVPVPWIPYFAQGGYTATMWGLFPYGGQGSDRVTMATLFLRGNETPEMRIKDDSGDMMDGGEMSNWSGSFDNDDIQVRIRYFTGGAVLDRVGFCLSKGDASANT